jgi:hypothetical protein
MVTEQEIEAALRLGAERKFGDALALYQEMLAREDGVFVRMKILFGIVNCSTWLGLDAIRDDAIRELKHLPDYEVSHAFIVMSQARVSIRLRSGQALHPRALGHRAD